jgi:Lar family restriction alleviation protein
MTGAAVDALPCPFCGCQDVTVFEGSTFRWRYAACDGCGVQGVEVRHNATAPDQAAAEAESHQRAIDEWNRRAPSAEGSKP